MADSIKREPQLTLLSDASFFAIGGVDPAAHEYWWYGLTAEHKSRLVQTAATKEQRKKQRAAERRVLNSGLVPININLLELIGMVATAYVFTHGRVPEYPGDSVRWLGDNQAAVEWLKRCGGITDPRGSAVMRAAGAMMSASLYTFEPAHIAGKKNVLADGVSRLLEQLVQQELTRLHPGLPVWRQVALPQVISSLISSTLAAHWQPQMPGPAQWTDMTAAGARGCCFAASSASLPS